MKHPQKDSAAEQSIHGCAVAIGDQGWLILGPSGVGKSRLVAELVSSWHGPDVRLVADDRVLLSRASGRLIARPHPAIAGQLECRGIGICRMELLEAVVLRGVFELVAENPDRLPEKTTVMSRFLDVELPCFTSLADAHAAIRLRMILRLLCDETELIR